MKAVLFDLDGTLLNRDASVQKLALDQAARFGIEDKEKFVHRFIELDARGYVWKDKVYQQLLTEFDFPEKTWEDLLEDYLDSFPSQCVPFENLHEMLNRLKTAGYKLGMITNGFDRLQAGNIEALGIADYFQCILISEGEGMKKPDPRIFQKCLELLGAVPEESVYVGDHPDNDMKAAKAVGMKTIWKRDAHWKEAEADWEIDELMEIPALLKRMAIHLEKVPQEDRESFIPFLVMADENEDIVRGYIQEGELYSIHFGEKEAGACLVTNPKPGVAEIKNIAICPEMRGKGIGKAAIEEIASQCSLDGYSELIVGTANSSLDNIAFYQKAGFQMTGIKKDFFLSYPEPIVENGIRAIDMIMFKRGLS